MRTIIHCVFVPALLTATACGPVGAKSDDDARQNDPRHDLRYDQGFVDFVDAAVALPDGGFWLARRIRETVDGKGHSLVERYDAALAVRATFTTDPGVVATQLVTHPSGAVTVALLAETGNEGRTDTLSLIRLSAAAERLLVRDHPRNQEFYWEHSVSIAALGEDLALQTYVDGLATLARLDADLEATWSRVITTRATDDLAYYGITTVTATPDGGIITTNKLDADDVDAFNDAFEAPLAAAGELDVVMSLFTGDGAPIYHALFGTPGNDLVHAATITGDRIVLVGNTDGTPRDDVIPNDLWVNFATHAGGVLYLGKSFDLKNEDSAAAVTALADGTVVVGGKTGFVQVKTGSVVEPADAFVLALDQHGEETFRDVFGTSRDDSVYALATLADGRVLAAGVEAGPITHSADHDPSGAAAAGFARRLTIVTPP